ncbi:MAG: hypothetical protein MPW15_30150 (plasmid) [Candidatus Manganitrophus sp.]|nr:hypothetical protein [Candidatus Manganitrophus sp.]MDC4228382.1 hypothetical protein [Candidatus Manganitrophus sp.]WDT77833.1 MAG: hypothetical protein MPW16_21645 [Candidatus Manganitrophus sp.]
MDGRKKDDFWGLLVVAVSLILIIFFLIALIFLGRELVVRLNTQITEGIQQFHSSQKEIMP